MQKVAIVILGICLIGFSCINKNEKKKESRQIVGTFTGGTIFLDQVDSSLQNNFYKLRKKEIEESIFQTLLKIEAHKRKSTPEAILNALHTIQSIDGSPKHFQVISHNRFLEYRDSLFKVYSVNIALDSQSSTYINIDEFVKYYRGDIKSNIDLCIISDIQCPSCQLFEKDMKFIYHKYKNKVKFSSLIVSEGADKGAVAADAAGLQGKFWEMHDFLFENPQAALTDSLTIKFATLINLDCKKFSTDFNNKTLLNKFIKQNELLRSKYIRTVPTIVLNGKILLETPTVNILDKIIEEKLKIYHN